MGLNEASYKHGISPPTFGDSGLGVQLTVLVHTEPLVFSRSLSYGVSPPSAAIG